MKKLLLSATVLLFSVSVFAKNPLSGIAKVGPWVTNVTETSFTVVWTTEQKDLGWVELAPNDGTHWNKEMRPRYYELINGRRYAGTFHQVTINGLEPGTTYRYCLGGRVILVDQPYNIEYAKGNNDLKITHSVTTLDPTKDECRFTVVNDMHYNYDKYKTLMSKADKKNLDFVLLNGDIVSDVPDIDTVIRYIFEPLGSLACDKPVVYVQGNHECRGKDWYLMPRVFPTSTGKTYFTFRQGPVGFVALDACEDKPDSNEQYFGYAEFENYRVEELEWLKEAVKDPKIAEAPVKICLIHVPLLVGKDCWFSQSWMSEHFLPVLNEFGIQAMFSGHHHKHFVVEKGEGPNTFPIFVNDTVSRTDVRVTRKAIEIKYFDLEGKQTHAYTVNL